METTSIERTQSLTALAKALAKAQSELKNPPKDRVNPHYKSKYADLATVRDCVLPVLNRYGLSVVQLPCEWQGRPALYTLLLHESGEYLGSILPLRLVKDDPQGLGSALTYTRRYALQAIAGVAGDEDNDAESASSPAKTDVRSASSNGSHSTSRSSTSSADSKEEVSPQEQLRQEDRGVITAMIGCFRPYGLEPEDLARRFGVGDVYHLTNLQVDSLRTIYREIQNGSPVEKHFPWKKKKEAKHDQR